VTRLAREEGFTMIEVLITLPLAMVVAVGLMWLTITSLHQGDAADSRASSTIQAQVGLNRLTQDLSEAIAANNVTMSQTASSVTVTFDIPDPSNADAAEAVTWTCPYSAAPAASLFGSCTRKVGSGSTMTEITGIESAAFAPLSASGSAIALTSTPTAYAPAYIGITLDLAVVSQLNPKQTTTVQGVSTPIVVQGGVDLRNFT
jgi:Tfp pilus assembly protein PilV